jgi:hypothetical protein
MTGQVAVTEEHENRASVTARLRSGCSTTNMPRYLASGKTLEWRSGRNWPVQLMESGPSTTLPHTDPSELARSVAARGHEHRDSVSVVREQAAGHA